MSDSRANDRPRAVDPDADDRTAPAYAAGADRRTARADDADRRDTVAREKEEFGGMRFFLAFFGWLTATGAVVLLTAIITGVLAATGVQNSAGSATQDRGALQTAGVLGIVALAFVLFVGYYIGGYVAGRMARFSGLKQGLAVWIWAVIITVVVAIVVAVAGSSSGAFSQLGGVGIPVDGTALTATGISSLVVAIVFSLAGALLGGLGGMRFHRKVDRFARQA